DATGDTAHYDRMVAKLDQSLAEYRELTELASAAYRYATDLGDYYQWTTVRKSFEEEAAFYHEQSRLSERGGDVVYFGLDGPMSDATNVFHWELEQARKERNWTAQSYRFSKNPLEHAKLAIVYDAGAPEYKNRETQIDLWVRNGGKLLVWDPVARAARGGLLAGIEFQADPSHLPAREFAFTD